MDPQVEKKTYRYYFSGPPTKKL